MANYFTKNEREKMDAAIVGVSVDTGDNSSPYTTFTATGSFSSVDDYYVGYTVEFTSGGLSGQSFLVTGFTAATDEFVIEDAGAEIASAVTFNVYATITIEDNKHNQPFTNLSILINPTSVTTYDYEVIYDVEIQQSGSITSLQDMITYSDASQVFPANETNSNWARQQAGDIINGYPIKVTIIHKHDSVTLFKISIISETASAVV